MEGKCSTGVLFYCPKSTFCSLNLHRLLKSPVVSKYPKFLKLSNTIYSEFLRRLQTLSILDALVLKGEVRPVNDYLTHTLYGP